MRRPAHRRARVVISSAGIPQIALETATSMGDAGYPLDEVVWALFAFLGLGRAV